jgi:hypothetical protein
MFEIAWIASFLQVRRILDVLRGRPYEQCVKMMELMPYRACEPILKTLKSVSTATGSALRDVKEVLHPAVM